MQYTGLVTNGIIVLENGNQLPEGTRVRVDILEPKSGVETLGDFLLQFAGTIPDLPKDMAEQHDHYLHGQPKK
jgi:hypothetical protein